MNIQEVERVSEKIGIHSSNIDDIKKQMDKAEDAVLRTDQQQRQCDESAERLKQQLSAAETKLERLMTKRHCLLVFAVVLYACQCAIL